MFILLLIVLLSFFSVNASAYLQEIPTVEVTGKEWVEDFLNQPITDGARTHRYLKQVHDFGRNSVDLEWLTTTKNADTFRNMRPKSRSVGQLAYLYARSGIDTYRTQGIKDTLKTAFLTLPDRVNEDGYFTWENLVNEWGYDSQVHGHGWILEPWLYGYIWNQDLFSDHEQERIEAALYRASQWLYEHPKLENNNRGIAWAAILSLAARYFEEQEWLDMATYHAKPMIETIIFENGEIGEHDEQYAGGGPDANYTYTSIAYLYAYRLWSHDRRLEDRFDQAAKWLAGYNSISMWPMVTGASVRTDNVNGANFRDVLPFWEIWSKKDPFYALMAEKALQKIEQMSASAFSSTTESNGHLTAPAIFAIYESSNVEWDGKFPEWFTTRNEVFKLPKVDYALVGRHYYQTGITFRARNGFWNNSTKQYKSIPATGYPLRGLQTWAWKDELPIILNGDGGLEQKHSLVRSGGSNTAEFNVDELGFNYARKIVTSENGNHSVLVLRQKGITTIFVFTPGATVAYYHSEEDGIQARWFMNRDILPGHRLRTDANMVTFAGREARLYYTNGEANSSFDQVEIATISNQIAFGFSNVDFSFDKSPFSNKILEFSDLSGSYALDIPSAIEFLEVDAPKALSEILKIK